MFKVSKKVFHRHITKYGRRLTAVGIVGLAALAIIGLFAASFFAGRASYAAPYVGCSPNGYIIKDAGSNTDVQAVDMVTGKGTALPQVSGHRLNAIGYNPKDNHFYAWDILNAQYVKLDANLNVVSTWTTVQVGYSGPTTTDLYSGDVDEDGFHWFFRVASGQTHWYKIDTSLATPTVVASGSIAEPTDAPDTLTEGNDWAYVPGTGHQKFYRAMDNGTSITIVAFDRSSPGYTVVGKVTNVTGSSSADRNMGAVFADPDGNFYMSSTGTGVLWRVDLDAPSGPGTFTAQQLDASLVGSSDGARCALASVPVDFGDAPNAYLTLIGSDGPRHSVIGFNINDSTAPLMLGTHVDIEADAFPTTTAKGDDDDHEGLAGSSYVDDERGVTSIVATPGTPTALAVPVTVTNNSSSVATLAGWIDLDNDQVFETSERVMATVNANSGTASYKLTFPSTTFTTNTYARFRVFSGTVADPQPSSFATGGEVEDVLVQVGSYDATKTADPAEGTLVSPGQIVTYTITIQNTGATALTNLKVDDDLSNVLDDATLEGTPTVTPSSAGTAVVRGNVLEFAGDVGVGQSVLVTYKVKIKGLGSLGNNALTNTITAAHSTSCHPDVVNNDLTVSDPDCQTNHPINTTPLPSTGSDLMAPVVAAASLLSLAAAGLVMSRRAARQRG